MGLNQTILRQVRAFALAVSPSEPEVQNGLIERNAGVPPERRIEFRIGVHLADCSSSPAAGPGCARAHAEIGNGKIQLGQAEDRPACQSAPPIGARRFSTSINCTLTRIRLQRPPDRSRRNALVQRAEHYIAKAPSRGANAPMARPTGPPASDIPQRIAVQQLRTVRCERRLSVRKPSKAGRWSCANSCHSRGRQTSGSPFADIAAGARVLRQRLAFDCSEV